MLDPPLGLQSLLRRACRGPTRRRVGKEDGQRVIGRLDRTLLDEHEKLFGSYWRHTFGPSSSLLQLLGKGVSVRTDTPGTDPGETGTDPGLPREARAEGSRDSGETLYGRGLGRPLYSCCKFCANLFNI
jgi:hypothetical protein